MKYIAASLFAGLAVAGPMFEKRAVTTVEVVETAWSTTTVWVDPTAAPKNQFYEVQGGNKKKHSSSSSFSKPSSSAAPSAPSSAPVAPPSPSPEAPKSEVPSPSPAPAPKVEAPPPKVEPPPAPPAAAAPAPVSGGYTGDFTYYNPEGGQVSCGGSYTSSDFVAAIATPAMANGGNPNSNPNCGRKITVSALGKSATVTVVDTCAGCAGSHDVDVTEGVFKSMFGDEYSAIGRIKAGAAGALKWDWA